MLGLLAADAEPHCGQTLVSPSVVIAESPSLGIGSL